MKISFLPFLCLLALSLQLVSCKSDAGPNSNQALIRMVEEALAQAERLQGQHADFQKKFTDLDQLMATVPTEVKSNVQGYDDLEGRLDAIGGEKGDYRIRELSEMAAQLKVLRDDFSSGRVEAISVNQALVNMKPALTEHERAVTELAAEYEIVKRACDQVQAAVPTGGKGLVLFQAEAPKDSIQ